MNRRKFIYFSTGIFVISTGIFYTQFDSSDPLVAYIKSLKGIDEIGEYYKTNIPSKEDYLTLLKNKLKQSKQLQNIEETIKASILSDYQSNKIIDIDGWQLSQTEGLLAASFVTMKGYTKPVEKEIAQRFENAKVEDYLLIKNWGPQKTIRGRVFNQQSDGHAGIWFAIENPPPSLNLYIAGKKQTTFVNEKSITSGIHDLDDLKIFLNTVGKSEIAIYDEINHRKQIIGYFEVLEISNKFVYPDGTVSKVFCPIDTWGPQQAEKNKAFNIQPNGNAAIWIKTKCSPNTAKVLINNNPITTSVQQGIVTASSPIEELVSKNGLFKIELFDRKTKESLFIGNITIN